MSPIRWLLDVGLPRPKGNAVDTIHAQDLERIPGVSGICEARQLDRVLVTCNREFCGQWSVPLDHPGIVVLDAMPVDGKEIERELEHIEFRLQQYEDLVHVRDSRFYLKPGGYLARITASGEEEPLDPWNRLRIEEGASTGKGKELALSVTLR